MTSPKATNLTHDSAAPRPAEQTPPAADSPPATDVRGFEATTTTTTPTMVCENGHTSALPEAVQKPGKRRGKRPGAPRLNTNATKHGEKSHHYRLPLRKAGNGERDMIGGINTWRRDREAELLQKFGHISGYREARLVTACHWELCRRRRNRLARATTNELERIAHEEAAANDSERRDACLEKAGLKPDRKNGNEADVWAGLLAESDDGEQAAPIAAAAHESDGQALEEAPC